VSLETRPDPKPERSRCTPAYEADTKPGTRSAGHRTAKTPPGTAKGRTMITTDFVPGSPCWLDLGARDADAAAAFYRAVFDWQPARYPGLELTDAPGSLGWVELYTTDSPAAQAFYRSLFGWTTQDIALPGGGGTYTLIAPRGAGEERMHGGIMGVPQDFFKGGGKPYWHPVFGTADCDATVGLV